MQRPALSAGKVIPLLLWAMLPSFHSLSENTFNLIPNFLPPVTLSATFPHSSAGYQLELYT